MNDAFISYNWEIKTQVDILYRNLTNAGFKIWHDENKLSTDSQPLKAQLADAIDNSKIVICCITEAYCKSHVCNQEISFAESLAKPLIILMIQNLNVNKIHELQINGHSYKSNIGFIINPLFRKNCFNNNDMNPNWPNEHSNGIRETISKNLNELKDLFRVDLNKELLNNRYRIIEKIGFGAQSDVYKAQDFQNNNKM
jgi:hypothetical protein